VRDPAFDILKGIGITLVVVGHVYSGMTHRLIYVFHMPLFFLVSGYFFRASPTMKECARKMTTRLLIPYLSFLAMIQGSKVANLWSQGDVHAIVKLGPRSVVGGEKLTGATGVFWFITCLYLTALLYQLTAMKWSKNRRTLLSVGLLLLLSVANELWPKLWLPWALNVVPASYFFFHAGHLYGMNSWSERTGRSLTLLFSGFAFIYLTGIVFMKWPSMNMKKATMGWPFVTAFAAVSITYVALLLSRALARWPHIARSLSYLGAASSVVMYLHQTVQRTLRDHLDAPAWTRVVSGVLIPLFAYWLITRLPPLQFALLGRPTPPSDATR